jgi:Tfp pilus assembly protein PilF
MNQSESATGKNPESPSGSRGRSTAKGGKNRRRLLLIGIAVAVVGVVLLGIAAKFAYPRIKLARGRQDAVEAMSAMRKGQLDAAGAKVKTALAMAPKSPEVLRAAAQYCGLKGDPAGINYYQMLLATPAGGLGDQTNLIRLAHSTKYVGQAREVIRQMLQANSNDVMALQFLVENHLLADDRDRAIKSAAFGLKAHPTNAWFQFTLGSLLVDDPRGAKYQDEGRKLLFALAISQLPERNAAQNRIARSPNLTKAEMAVLQRQIQGRPDRSTEDEILLYDLRQRQNPEDAAKIVTEALTRYLTEDPNDGLPQVVGWAASGRQFESILRALPSKVAQTNAGVAPLYAGVLAASDQWDELERFLLSSESTIGKILSTGFRARLAMARGNRPEAESLFRSLGTVKEVPMIDAQILAEQAEAAGLPEVAVDIYQRIANNPGATIDASLKSLRLLSSLEDVAQVRELSKRLARIFPQAEYLAGEYAWASLVVGEDVAESRDTFGKLSEKTPSNPSWRYCLAYAELKMGRASKALELVQGAGVPLKDLSPRMVVVHALVLEANDQRDAARRTANMVDLKRLRPAERSLLKDLR